MLLALAWSGCRRDSASGARRSPASADLLAQLEGRKPARRPRRRRAAAPVPTGSPFLEGPDPDRCGRGAAAARRRRGDQGRRQRAVLAGRRAGRAGEGRLRQRAGKLRDRAGRAAAPALRSRSRHAVPVRRAVRRAGAADRAGAAGRPHAAAARGRRADGRATNERRARRIVIVAALLAGAIEARGANPPNALDQPPSNVLPAPVEITPSRPPHRAPASGRASRTAIRSGRSRSPRSPRRASVRCSCRRGARPRRRSPDAGRGCAAACSAAAGRTGAPAADAGRRHRGRKRGLRGVPRSGHQQCRPPQDRAGPRTAGCCAR